MTEHSINFFLTVGTAPVPGSLGFLRISCANDGEMETGVNRGNGWEVPLSVL